MPRDQVKPLSELTMSVQSKIITTVDIPPSTNLIKVLSNSGYTIEAAIADIVDNSIANQAKTINVDFKRKGAASTITVKDDGTGMDYEALKEAMCFAHHDISEIKQHGDLGRFGVGMKTASASFCKILRVESKGKAGIVNAFEFPFETKEWKIYQVEVSQKAISAKTGTNIIWKDLRLVNNETENKRILSSDAASFSEICDRVRRHLSKTFGLYLQKDVNIYVNGSRVEPWIPYEIPNGDVSQIYEDSSLTIGGRPVIIRGYLLPIWDHMTEKQQDYAVCHGGGKLSDYEGFYVYRNNRLLVSGGWLGLQELSLSEKFNYARVCVWFDATPEADLYFRVNYVKSSIVVSEAFGRKLINAAKAARKRSANSYDYKKNRHPYKRHDKAKDIHVWEAQKKEHAVIFSINEEHPLVKKYTQGLHAKKRKALLDLLARELPLKELANGDIGREAFSNDELEMMLRDSYELKKEAGVSTDKIVSAILSESPFANDNYRHKCQAILARILVEEKRNG